MSRAQQFLVTNFANKTLADIIKSTESANLIGYWPLSETPASQEYLTFNGTSTEVNCGSGASLDDLPSGGDFTIDFWIRLPSDYSGGTVRLFSKIDTNIGYNAFYNGTSIRFIMSFDATSLSLSSSASISASTWTHITIFFDQSELKARAAANGSWGSLSGAAVGNYAADNAEDFFIGSLGSLGGSFFDGDMGWFRVSDSDRYNGTAGTNFTAPARTTIPTVDANTVGLWPFNEGYGSVAGDLSANGNDGTITDGDWGAYPATDNAEGTAARDGAYTGVTLGQSVSPFTAPLFDGANDYVDIYSASLGGAISTADGTAIIFAKVSGSGVWTDGSYRIFFYIGANTNNQYTIYKSNSNNQLVFQTKYGGTGEIINKVSVSTTDWMCLAITWQKPGNFTAYYNGVAEGSPQAIAGTWAGALTEDYTNIGAQTEAPTLVMDGYLAHCAVWTKALTAPQILAIYQASGVA